MKCPKCGKEMKLRTVFVDGEEEEGLFECPECDEKVWVDEAE